MLTAPVRAFFGIGIPPERRGDVEALAARLKESGADVKWTRPESLHATLRFLGTVGPERIGELTEAGREAAAGFGAFEARLGGLGVFPGWANPEVFWAGFAEGADALTRLAARIEEALGRRGWPPEKRPFAPHLTIGRARGKTRLEGLTALLKGASFAPEKGFRVETLTLYRSLPGPAGSIYDPIREIGLI